MRSIYLLLFVFSAVFVSAQGFEICDGVTRKPTYKKIAKIVEESAAKGRYSLESVNILEQEDESLTEAIQKALEHHYPDAKLEQQGDENKEAIFNATEGTSFFIPRVKLDGHVVGVYAKTTTFGDAISKHSSTNIYLCLFYNGIHIQSECLSCYGGMSLEANTVRAIGAIKFAIEIEKEFYTTEHSKWIPDAEAFDKKNRMAVKKGKLYLPLESLSEDATQEKISEIYKADFEITSRQVIDDMIVAGEDCWVAVDFVAIEETEELKLKGAYQYYQMVFNPASGHVAYWLDDLTPKRACEFDIRKIRKIGN